jgi:hypothetical protein
VRILLAGGPLLEERLASPRLDSFSQRIAARAYLGSLSRDETSQYVQHQIGLSGGEPDGVFEPTAYEAIYSATGGVPRLVNQLCDHALVLAQLAGERPIGGVVIEEAWSDLQQLPSPWQMAPSTEASQVIEFAPLDELAEGPQAIPFRSAPPAAMASNPEQHLDQIERRLRELDDDFQPAGSIGPEIELRFDGPAHPFDEPYAEEEVVIDRYASLEADLFSDRPLVNSAEGRELGALLDPWLIQAPESTLSITAGLGANPPVVKLPAEAAAETAGGGNASQTTANPLPSRTVAASSDADAEIVIIDDEPLEIAPRRPTAPLVRRQEYRQLFAKLRHG